jgi:hypothetical protein
MLDANCDGIDGAARKAIFVAPTGSDSAAGTRAATKKTLAAAIAAAHAIGNGESVYAAAGTYPQTLVVSDGVSVHGGYSATDWSRSASAVTRVTGGPLADQETKATGPGGRYASRAPSNRRRGRLDEADLDGGPTS